MRQIGLIGGVLALIVGLALLNNGIGRNAQPNQDDDAPQQAAQTKPAPAVPVNIKALPAEEVVGSAEAKTKIAIGWVYDATNQRNPTDLMETLNAARQFARSRADSVSLVIADLDIPTEQRSAAARAVGTLGVSVDGRPVPALQDNPGEGRTTAAAVRSGLPLAIK